MLKSNEIYNLPCEEGLMQLDNESIDFVCIDPPYTDGKGTDVLNGHKIQTKLDILTITKEHFRVLKPNCFYAVFGQMPTILAWYNAAIESGFKFQDHITWAKRMQSGQCLQIVRTHEEIFIFKKGNAKYYKTTGRYEDVKIPELPLGLYDIWTLRKRIDAIQQEIREGKKVKISGSKFINDFIHNRNKTETFAHPENVVFSNSWVFEITEKEFNTVWSFLPQNKKTRGKKGDNYKHPTVKPVLLLNRLIELCTPESPEIIVLDSFIGSGTTYLAAQNTNRKCIGFEIAEEYYLLSKNRAAKNRNLFTV